MNSVRRCLFTAIDTWQLEAVQWMLKDNKDVDDAVENMMKFWNTTTDYQTFFQNAIAVQAPALKDDQLFSPLASVLKTLQAGLHGSIWVSLSIGGMTV